MARFCNNNQLKGCTLSALALLVTSLLILFSRSSNSILLYNTTAAYNRKAINSLFIHVQF